MQLCYRIIQNAVLMYNAEQDCVQMLQLRQPMRYVDNSYLLAQ